MISVIPGANQDLFRIVHSDEISNQGPCCSGRRKEIENFDIKKKKENSLVAEDSAVAVNDPPRSALPGKPVAETHLEAPE